MKLRLKALLKRLQLIKYRYKITTTIENFKEKKYQGNFLSINNSDVTFYAFKLTKKMKEDEQINVKDRLKLVLSFLFKSKVFTTYSLIIILGMFFLSNFFIREVKFTNEDTYDYFVLQDVNLSIKNIGPFKRVEKNLNELSNDLREKYYFYSYIGVRKKAGTLYIDIEKHKNYSDINIENTSPCDIVSCVDGKVIGFEVEKGIPVVSVNQIVKKGDLLITGNINYQVDKENLSKLVHSCGVVLLEYACYEEVKIPKKVCYEHLEQEYKKRYNIYFFNIQVGNNRKDESYSYEKSDNIFVLKNVFKVEKVSSFRVESIVKEISFDEAKVVSEQKIYTSFLNNKVSSKEEIKLLRYIKYSETDDCYTFYYLVKYVQNKTMKVYY